MVDEQAHLTLRTVKLSGWQILFTERRAGHGQRIDRVALARLARRASAARDELGWNAHDALTRSQKVGFKATGEVPAVLDGE